MSRISMRWLLVRIDCPLLEYCDGKSKYLARPLAFSYG